MDRYAVDAVFSDGSHFDGMITEALDTAQALVNVAKHYNEVRYGRPDRVAVSLSARLAERGKDFCVCGAIVCYGNCG